MLVAYYEIVLMKCVRDYIINSCYYEFDLSHIKIGIDSYDFKVSIRGSRALGSRFIISLLLVVFLVFLLLVYSILSLDC